MTTTMTGHATSLLPMAKIALGYAQAVCKDIEPERFGRRPDGVDCNTPAWVIGHLSVYPDRILELIGRADLAQTDERYQALFKDGTASPDDPDGTHYPPKDELLARFIERTETAIGALAGTDDSVMLRENPVEGRFREMCPTVGAAAGFLLGAHTMMHLGQISTWRRCMGLGHAM
jgi:hypothetical protein